MVRIREITELTVETLVLGDNGGDRKDQFDKINNIKLKHGEIVELIKPIISALLPQVTELQPGVNQHSGADKTNIINSKTLGGNRK